MFELFVALPYCYESSHGSFATLDELLAAAEDVELDPDEEMYYCTPEGEWVDL